MPSFIKFRYPPDDYQLVPGDSWDLNTEYINTTLWQATGLADVTHPTLPNEKMGWFTKHLFPEQITGNITENYNSNLGQKYTITFRFENHTCYQLSNLDEDWFNDNGYGVNPSLITGFHPSPLYKRRNDELYSNNPVDWFDNPVLLRWHPVNGQREATFKVFLDGLETFSRTEINNYPTGIELIEGYECPQDTCVVECQDTICCYGSDGFSVDQFLKSESIYQ